MIIKNGRIHDAVRREPYAADILIKNGKIAAIGEGLGGDEEVFDAAGLDVYPGFVEAHCTWGWTATASALKAPTTMRWATSAPLICAPSTASIPWTRP